MSLLILGIIGGSAATLAYIRSKQKDRKDKNTKYLIREDEVLVETARSPRTLEAQSSRRLYKSYQLIQQQLQKELAGIQRPLETDLRKIKPNVLLKINEILIRFHKTYIRNFRVETLQKRTEYLRDKQIGQYILQKLQDIKEEQSLFSDVVDLICDELTVNQKLFLSMLDKFQNSSQYQAEIQQFHEMEDYRVKFDRKYLRGEGVQMMVYVLNEMKVILEEYPELQTFVKEATPEDLQDVLDGMIADLFYLYYGLSEEQYKKLVEKKKLNEDPTVQEKYEDFMALTKFYLTVEKTMFHLTQSPPIIDSSTISSNSNY